MISHTSIVLEHFIVAAGSSLGHVNMFAAKVHVQSWVRAEHLSASDTESYFSNAVNYKLTEEQSRSVHLQ